MDRSRKGVRCCVSQRQSAVAIETPASWTALHHNISRRSSLMDIPEEPAENVRVVIRCRPPLESETGDEIVIRLDEENNCLAAVGRQFTFDRVFGFESSQNDIYSLAGKQIVDSVLEGYNGTIFAYGQTGTGKTFTQSGLMDNCFDHVFDFISASGKDMQFLVRVSYYEIYNEEIKDLLKKRTGKSLELRESGPNSVYVKNLSCYVVNNVTDLQKLKAVGQKQRAIASTNMNAQSSRSHTVFTMTIEMITNVDKNPQGQLRVGKLNLVDLAGSERQAKAGTSGDRLKEAAKINLSLTSLSLVIAALTDPNATHVPYRNSKLTRILSDSLGGNSKTLLIACIGPCKSNLDESLSTLRFASTTKKIKNKAKINEDSKDTLLRKFQEQIAELRKQLELTEDGTVVEEEGDDGTQAAPINSEAAEKLKMLEDKIMMGGENLLEKAERQERQLAETEAELQAFRDKERRLQSALQQKDAEIEKMEESYGSLTEEVAALNKKLKKVFNYLTAAKEELADCQSEYSQLRDDLLDSIRATNKEIKLANFLIDRSIPGIDGPNVARLSSQSILSFVFRAILPNDLRNSPVQRVNRGMDNKGDRVCRQ